MERKKYDIFISYRRKDAAGNIAGRDIARCLKHYLETKKYSCFFDYSECTDGEFEDIILPAIRNSNYFFLVMTNGALDRCAEEGDWVRREIIEAISTHVKIIPIKIIDVDHPEISFRDDSFPSLQDPLNRIKSTQWSEVSMGALFEASVNLIIENRIKCNASNNKDYELSNKKAQQNSFPVIFTTDEEKVLFDIDECDSLKQGSEVADILNKSKESPSFNDDTIQNYCVEKNDIVKKNTITDRAFEVKSVGQSMESEVKDIDGLIINTKYQQRVYENYKKILNNIEDVSSCQNDPQQHYVVIDCLKQLNAFCSKYKEDDEVSTIYLAASMALEKLKQKELERMKNDADYNQQSLFLLMEKGVFTIEELSDNKIAPYKVLKTAFDNRSIYYDDRYDVYDSNTKKSIDVFFWGGPHAGHTSIIASMINTNMFFVENTRIGEMMHKMIRCGIQVPASNNGYPLVLQGYYYRNQSTFNFNLIDNSGQDFMKIVNGSGRDLSFKDVERGESSLITRDNKKIFFILVDPTCSYNDCFLDNVDQEMLLQQFVEKLGLSENRYVMRNVCGIHVVITKTDTLKAGEFIVEKSRKIIDRMRVLKESLINLCDMYDIKNLTLHPFCLGDFYHCGLFQFDDKYARELMKVVMDDIERSTSKPSNIFRFFSQ